MNDFLLKNYFRAYGGGSSDIDEEEILELIQDFYLKIAELVMGNNRDMARNAMEIFITVYSAYINRYSVKKKKNLLMF